MVVDAQDHRVPVVNIGTSVGPIAAACGVVTLGVAARPRIQRRPHRVQPAEPPTLRERRARRSIGLLIGLPVASVLALVLGVAGAGVVLATLFGIRRLRPLRNARRRRADIDRSLPDAMDLLVLNVRAGRTPFQAVCDLAATLDGDVGDAFGEVVRRTERGQSFADALRAVHERLGPRAGGLADVIATSDRHGLPLGPVLDQLTIEAREARRRLEQAEARRLPVRLSFPLVVCTLPSFVLLAIVPAVIAALSSLGTTTAW
jgi:tight adherence protein C